MTPFEVSLLDKHDHHAMHVNSFLCKISSSGIISNKLICLTGAAKQTLSLASIKSTFDVQPLMLLFHCSNKPRNGSLVFRDHVICPNVLFYGWSSAGSM
jgi:hypothetical protein